MNAAVIDSHLHVWDLSRGRYPWLTPQREELYRSFLPDEAAHALGAAGVDAAVLVQAEDSTQETEYLLEVAAEASFVAGVVGWIYLDNPSAADKQLDTYTMNGRLRGVRHLVHDDPRADFLSLPTVRISLGFVADYGLVFDVPDAWSRHMKAIRDLADQQPRLSVVVDHLGKPPRDSQADMRAWARVLNEIAARPNTYAKVSGLHRSGQAFSSVALRPVMETALQAFGAERLMYGSDWPLTPPGGHYLEQWQVFQELIGSLSATEQDALRRGTAAKVYRLEEGQ